MSWRGRHPEISVVWEMFLHHQKLAVARCSPCAAVEGTEVAAVVGVPSAAVAHPAVARVAVAALAGTTKVVAGVDIATEAVRLRARRRRPAAAARRERASAPVFEGAGGWG